MWPSRKAGSTTLQIAHGVRSIAHGVSLHTRGVLYSLFFLEQDRAARSPKARRRFRADRAVRNPYADVCRRMLTYADVCESTVQDRSRPSTQVSHADRSAHSPKAQRLRGLRDLIDVGCQSNLFFYLSEITRKQKKTSVKTEAKTVSGKELSVKKYSWSLVCVCVFVCVRESVRECV